MTPRVSILLPVYNAASTLDECLSSIAQQTLTELECIIVDDGSSDDSLVVAKRWAERDARFEVLAEPHRGLVDSLNVGIDACRAAVIARMDADDVMLPKRLELQLAALADQMLAGVGCHVHIVADGGVSEGRRAYQDWLNAISSPADVVRELFIECPIAHPSLMLRADLLRRLRYRDEGWPEDYDLIQRMHAEGLRLAVVADQLLEWRDGPTRLSRNNQRYAIEAFTRCRAHFLATTLLRGHDRYVLWGYGGTGKALRRALSEHSKTPHAIVELHPGRLGQTIFGAQVIAPEALATLRSIPILTSVAGLEARSQIRDALSAMGFSEGRDYVCCA